MKGKKGQGLSTSTIVLIILAVAVLVILMITAFLLRGQGVNIIDQIKGLFGG